MNQTFTNLLVWLAAIDSIFLVSQKFNNLKKIFSHNPGMCDSLLLPPLPLPLVQVLGVPPDPPLPPPPD